MISWTAEAGAAASDGSAEAVGFQLPRQGEGGGPVAFRPRG